MSDNKITFPLPAQLQITVLTHITSLFSKLHAQE